MPVCAGVFSIRLLSSISSRKSMSNAERRSEKVLVRVLSKTWVRKRLEKAAWEVGVVFFLDNFCSSNLTAALLYFFITDFSATLILSIYSLKFLDSNIERLLQSVTSYRISCSCLSPAGGDNSANSVVSRIVGFIFAMFKYFSFNLLISKQFTFRKTALHFCVLWLNVNVFLGLLSVII